MKKIALISLGCAKNLVDSEVMLGHLIQAGYSFVPSIKNAEIIIINTCGFISFARKEAEDAIKKALKIKKKKGSICTQIVVTGCYVQRDLKLLKKKFPQVDDWIGVNDFHKIVQVTQNQPFKPSPHTFLYDHTSPRCLTTPKGWAYIKISEGCSHRCSFCSIPLIKGLYRSRKIESVVSEARSLALKGIQEINLISHDSTNYGQDLGLKNGLKLLLEELAQIRELKWIRILYGHPEKIKDELLESMREEKICPYLDLPFQHSHPEIIKLMRRKLDGKQALELIQKIREQVPGIAIRTSLVVGFPGEGSREFDHLIKFVKEAKFDHLGAFTYSQERDTPCWKWGDPVSEKEKLVRLNELMQVQSEISYQRNMKYRNQILDVLIEEVFIEDQRFLAGRSRYQAPEVDGMVLVERNDKDYLNTIQKVEISSSDIYDLFGYFTP